MSELDTIVVPDLQELLGGLSAEQFLRDYWQKRPLLIRAAIPGFRSPLSADELAGLALEEDVESRLVLEHGEYPWELRHGPFAEDAFAALPESHWTLLVQDVDKHIPELARLLRPFRFIPDWRIDDLMISYAAPEGSVGPHVDQYDVFLLQAHGRRRWQIQHPAPAAERLLEGVDLRILAEFQPTEEWVLEPGDMLYLPPGVPHHGVALEACMTYSIGFRAPSDQDLLDDFSLWQLEQADTETRYTDPDLRPSAAPGELDEAARDKLRAAIRARLQPSDEELDRFLGHWLTEPKPLFAGRELDEPWSPERLCRELTQAERLRRNPAARVLLIRRPERSYLFADGLEYPLDDAALALAAALAAEPELSAIDWRQPTASALALLTALINADVIELE